MAKTQVEFSLPEFTLKRSDIELKAKKNGTLIGTLRVSNGSVVWFSRNAREGTRIGWDQFARLVEHHAHHVRTSAEKRAKRVKP